MLEKFVAWAWDFDYDHRILVSFGIAVAFLAGTLVIVEGLVLPYLLT